jgi:hypothetical protein
LQVFWVITQRRTTDAKWWQKLTWPLARWANKTKCSIKLNIYFLYWYFQQNQCLSITNHAVYNIHRLVWGSFAHGTQVFWVITQKPLIISEIWHEVKMIYLQFWSKSDYPFWSYCPFFINFLKC